MAGLDRVRIWQRLRPATCRACGRSIGHGEDVLADNAAPWLVIHVVCLRRLVPERATELVNRLDELLDGDALAVRTEAIHFWGEIRRESERLLEETERLRKRLVEPVRDRPQDEAIRCRLAKRPPMRRGRRDVRKPRPDPD